jgi:hypothetical protein
MNSLLQAALDYAARGLAVFPCVPGGKEPAVKCGFYAATTNPETIKRYWYVADRNIGIRTGAASGFWVLDIDHKIDGEVSLRALEAKHGPLPRTAEVISGGGGRHLWFCYTSPIACSASRVGPGLDVRGDGGCIIVPPSIHPSGQRYEWSVDSTVLAVAPGWLVVLTRKRPVTISERAIAQMRRSGSASNGYGSSAYGAAALDREIDALANTPQGQRNHALNRASFSLFQLVAGGELSESEVLDRLLDAARTNGLMTDPGDGPRKVFATISSGRRAGLQQPRSRSGAA